MPLPSNVSSQILTARLKAANMSLTNITALQSGALSADWKPIIKATRAINCVNNQYSIGDTSSPNFLIAYACMNAFVGQYAGGPIDPNAQNPGVTIEISGSAPFLLNKTEANLLFDTPTQQWYLPYLNNNNAPITTGQVPVSVIDNGASFTFTFDETFSPPRIYGFAGNDTQIITVTCV